MAAQQHRSFCHLCAPYCGVVITVDDDRVIEVRGDPDHPVSQGYVCPKGRALGDLHHDHRRLDRPATRVDGALVDVTWDEALDDLVARIASTIEQSGPDAVALYQGTPALHETVALPAMGKLLHKLGTRSRYSSLTVDIAAKLAVTPRVLGAQLLPVIDIDDTRLLLVIGTNPVVSHGQYNGLSDPVTRLRAIAGRGEVWVIDPRRTETAAHATTYLPIRPGTDHALLAYLVREMLQRGVAPDVAARLDGIDELAAAVAPWDMSRTSSTTGMAERDLVRLVDAIDAAGRISLLTGTGVTMARSANATEWLALALLLLTDSFDQPGGMWCNPGYTLRRDRKPIAPEPTTDGRAGPDSRPDLPRFLAEHPCAALTDEIEAGNVKILISFGGNPLVAIAQPGRLRRALAHLDAFVVIGTVRDAQLDLATHVLPAADGLERAEALLSSQSAQLRVVAQYAPAIVPLGADRRPSWWIVGQIAKRLGLDVLPGRLDPDRASDDELLAAMVGDEAFDAMRAHDGPLVGERRVTGWVLDALPHRPQVAPPELLLQLRALTAADVVVSGPRIVPRRRLRRFNSVNSPTGRQDLQEVMLHPDVAARAGVVDGGPVRLTSANGSLVGTAVVSDHIDPGAVAVSHGFTDVEVGNLTSTSTDVDPLSGQITQVGVDVRIDLPPEPGTSDGRW